MAESDMDSDVDIEVLDEGGCDIREQLLQNNTIEPKSTTSPSEVKCQSFVSARTDGIRGQRYLDIELSDSSSSPESGELSDSDDDVSIKKEPAITNLEPQLKQVSITVKQEPEPASSGVIHPSYQITNAPAFKTFAFHKDIDTSNDVNGIQNILSHQVHHEVPTSSPGVDKLVSSFRDTRNAITVDSSEEDDEGLNFDSESDSSSDGECRVPMSVTSEITKMEKMNIKDHPNMEVYPEVEIVDLTLSTTENIVLLGKITKIVEDFVVVLGSNPNKVLDIDSMVFNKFRKCVGYVFEVLGPVKEPYYSIHFNTASDIPLYGLHLHQELYYSTNERYSRFLLVNMLQELELSGKFKHLDSDDGNESSDSFESLDENEDPQVPTKLAGSKRKPKSQLKTRTTNNYSLNYNTSMNYKAPRLNNKQKQRGKAPPAPSQASPQIQAPSSSSTSRQTYKVRPKEVVYNTPGTQSVNSFQNSVMASFLDPFGLEKKD